MHNYRAQPFLSDHSRQIARAVRQLDRKPIVGGSLEDTLANCRRPEFIPHVHKSLASGDRFRVQYWLRRAMGLSGT